MKEKPNHSEHSIPKDHPRYQSLLDRHKIIEGMKKLIVAEAGLIAHGRGECFDYIIGEKTNNASKAAMKVAVAMLMSAKNPIISVNGNVAALCSRDLANFSNISGIPLEINLFYRKPGRVEAIYNLLKTAGARQIYGGIESEMVELGNLSSNRRNVHPNGIKIADVVLVPLEDGDRTEALKKHGKAVIAVDLNPLSRTALCADVTIVDNIIRVIPYMLELYKELKNYTLEKLQELINSYDNKKNLIESLNQVISYLRQQNKLLLSSKSI